MAPDGRKVKRAVPGWRPRGVDARADLRQQILDHMQVLVGHRAVYENTVCPWRGATAGTGYKALEVGEAVVTATREVAPGFDLLTTLVLVDGLHLWLQVHEFALGSHCCKGAAAKSAKIYFPPP